MPAELHLLRPYWLLALLPLALVLALWWRQRGDDAHWRRLCDPRLLPYLLLPARGSGLRPWLAVFGAAALLAVLALAGPVWKKLEQPVFRDPGALVILLDLSSSMDSQDLKPSRLERARLKLLDILRQRREGQTALAVYAGQAFPVVPLTEDTDTIAALVGTLETSLMPSQGSRPDLAITQAVELLAQAGVPRGDILLITDGSGSAPAVQAAERATASGHRVHVLAVGAPEGAPIPIRGGGFLKDAQGNIVVPALDRDGLRELAARGGGRYAELSVDDRDLDYLLGGLHRSSALADAEESGLSAERWREEGPWLILLALPLAALAFRRGLLLVLLAFLLPLPPPAQALEWPDWWQRPDQQAAALLQDGDAAAAADRFDDPEWRAAASYRAGAYEQAVASLADLDTPDALYNKGNALARAGKLQEALDAYDQALARQPEHADAAYNRKLVEEALKQQSQPQQGQGEDKPQDSQGQQQESKDGSSGGRDEPQASQNESASGESDSQPPAGESGSAQHKSADQAQNEAPETGEDNQEGQSGSKDRQTASQSQEASSDESAAQQQGQNSPADAQTKASEADEPPESEGDAASTEPAQAGQEDKETSSPPADSAEVDPELAEQNQAERQWLRRIPDDPGGLLRRKFLYQYQRLANPRTESQNW